MREPRLPCRLFSPINVTSKGTIERSSESATTGCNNGINHSNVFGAEAAQTCEIPIVAKKSERFGGYKVNDV